MPPKAQRPVLPAFVLLRCRRVRLPSFGAGCAGEILLRQYARVSPPGAKRGRYAAAPLDSPRTRGSASGLHERVGPLPEGPLACLRQTIECFRGTASGAETGDLRSHERLLTRLPAGLGRSRGEGGRSASIITIDRLEVAFSTIANRFGPSVENDSRRWVHPAPNDKSRLPAFCRITCYNRGPSPPSAQKTLPTTLLPQPGLSSHRPHRESVNGLGQGAKGDPRSGFPPA